MNQPTDYAQEKEIDASMNTWWVFRTCSIP